MAARRPPAHNRGRAAARPDLVTPPPDRPTACLRLVALLAVCTAAWLVMLAAAAVLVDVLR
jgi:hypothetical protein